MFLGDFTGNTGSYLQDCGRSFSSTEICCVTSSFACVHVCAMEAHLWDQVLWGQNWLSCWGRYMKAPSVSATYLKIKYSSVFGLGQTKTTLILWADLSVFRGKVIKTHTMLTNGHHFAWAYPEVARYSVTRTAPCRSASGSSVLKNPWPHHHSDQLFSRALGRLHWFESWLVIDYLCVPVGCFSFFLSVK